MISLFFSIHLFGCFLLPFLSPLAQAATGECSIPPLYLPWRNIAVSLDGLAVTRGIELGIGTPSQIFSLRPATTLNNTRISNVLECVSLTNTTCIGAAGGVFDATKSSTYEVSIRSAWNGSQADQETATGSYVYFNDVLKFERNGSVLGFPLVNAGLEGEADNGIPLGVDSSFLKTATNGLVAPSSAWSLWAGSRSLSPVDGALVIGGYDSARILPNTNLTTFPIGSWTSSRHIRLSPSRNRTPHKGLSLPGLNYPISQRPDGNLTVILNNGYKTVVPNSELFTIKRGSDDLGRYAIVNDSLVDSGINYNANADPASVRAILGGMFLTQDYLVVDYEMGIFKMAPAVQGPLDENRANLVPICSQRGDSVNGTDTSKPDPTAKTNVGAIAGGVVGGVGALVGIVLGVWWLLKRKRKVREEKNRRELENTHRQSSMLSVSELPSPVHPPGPPKQLYELPSP
ncbi:hypothetical protein IFR04_013801 [Cadophora malorum]|uniref:receptor protein-tyrosine kinase n=1 Tax=Cadophora malorum TaxID=108018 RepID=A0A8H7T422_9HELO|nr:hypothetical protein IFR04_013801 [Cadophora malorum]